MCPMPLYYDFNPLTFILLHFSSPSFSFINLGLSFEYLPIDPSTFKFIQFSHSTFDVFNFGYSNYGNVHFSLQSFYFISFWAQNSSNGKFSSKTYEAILLSIGSIMSSSPPSIDVNQLFD